MHFRELTICQCVKGVISKLILQVGHAVTHRAWNPTGNDVKVLLDITESIIQAVYLHDQSTDALDRKTPRRMPRMRP